MSVFDKVDNYFTEQKQKSVGSASGIFDTSTVEGAYYNAMQSKGYKLAIVAYKLIDKANETARTPEYVTMSDYDKMSVEDKVKYKPDLEGDYAIKYTELYNALNAKGNQCIIAAAGAGKTTAIIAKLQHDIVTGECMTTCTVPSGMTVRVTNKVWVCTFLNSGAKELSEALKKWQAKLGYTNTANQVVFSTLDAEFKRCLESMGVAVTIGDTKTLNSALSNAIRRAHITRSDGGKLTKEDFRVIGGIVTYARTRLDDSKYDNPNASDYGLTKMILDTLIEFYADERRKRSIMDFEDLSELLYKYLYVEPNPAVQDVVANRYNYIYIDEFQDTSQIQYAILRFYARGKLVENEDGYEGERDACFTGVKTKGKIVVVGDPSQTIYSFRGSDSRVLVEDFPSDFNPVTTPLSVNWRCPENVLHPVINSIHKNADSKNQLIRSAKLGGKFYAYEFSTMASMIKQLEKDVVKDVQDDKTVAILCRTNYDGLVPALVLESKNLCNFSVTSEAMSLDSALPRSLINVANLFMNLSTKKVEDALNLLVPFYNRYEVKQLLGVLSNTQGRGKRISIWTMPIEDIRYSCPSLLTLVKDVRQVMFDEDGNKYPRADINGLKFIYEFMITNTFAKNTQYNDGAKTILRAFIDLIDLNNYATVREFVSDITLLNDKIKARVNKKSASVEIATVHEYKGKERDSVYIWNDVNGCFPSYKCNTDSETEVAEERRIHYIACTRAKERMHVYSIIGKRGMFANELDCKWSTPTETTVISVNRKAV